jgi:copper resistance protein C
MIWSNIRLSVFTDYYGVMKIIRLISAVAIAAFGSLLVATSANAHADVVNTSPVDGAVVEVPPAVISVKFSEPPLTEGAGIVLANVSGEQVTVGPVVVNGNAISVTSPADLEIGEYKVTWRATADDGHVLTGEFEFTFNGDAVVAGATPMMSALATDAQLSDEELPSEQANSNSWMILLASFVASATIGTIYVARKRK